MKYLYALYILFLITGCASKVVVPPQQEYISDLKNIPQDSSFYSTKIKAEQVRGLESYQKNYFKVWNLDAISLSLKEAKWAHNIFKVGNSYGENLQLHNEDFFENMLEEANFEYFSSYNKKAISLRNLSIRAFPTDRPLLRDPTVAGEGFPFDYLQNSTIGANKPLLISHYSKSREWAFVESSFAFGWVKVKDIVILEKKYTDEWQKAKQIFIIKDGISLYSKKNDFLFKSRVGMVLPLIEEKKDSYTLLSIGSYKNNEPLYIRTEISKDIGHNGILEFNNINVSKIIKEVSKTNYGWGGLYNQRDCSSTLRDYFAPFGLWLPRNSYKQGKVGKVLSLKNMTEEEKIKTIKLNAKPFKTLLYMKGHIVLYVGEYNGDIIIYHNTWAVKTKKDGEEGRFLIGKAIFSTLHIGSNLKYHNKEALLINRLESISML